MAERKWDFDYFDSYDSQQYQFIQIPMLLFTDDKFKGLSNAAKLLYGLMLNRAGLSKENNWVDENGRVYIIYTVEKVAEILGLGRDTAMKSMAELDSIKGIGLIERVRQGSGKPDLIYVKNFFARQEVEISDQHEAKLIDHTEVEKLDRSEVEKVDRQKSKKSTCNGRNFPLLEVENIDPNNININNTENSNTESINLSSDQKKSESETSIDWIDKIQQYTQMVKKNIDYDVFQKSLMKHQMNFVDEIVKDIVEVLCSNKQEMMKIGGVEYPLALVKQRMLELRFDHIEYVLECMREAGKGKEISNIKAYRLKTLFNAPTTMDSFYQAKVNYDMYAGGSS